MTCECVRGRRCAGFTYLGLLLAVAILAGLAATAASVWHLEVQREKEQELLFVGNEFRQAIGRYGEATQGTGRRYPMRLEDLLLDERMVEKRRHLRRIYADPLTGRAEWGLVRLADGQVIGVHSLAEERPLKQAGFRPRDEGFAGRTKYSEWQFNVSGGQGGQVPASGSGQSRPGSLALSK